MSTAIATTGTITNLKQGKRNSGIPWIGSIPTHWRFEPLMALANEQQVINSNGYDKNVLSLSYGNIVRRDVESNFGLLPESFNGYQIVESGDIILRLTDLQNDHRSLRTGLATERGIITSAYLCLRFHSEVSSEYAHYCLHAYDLLKVFYSMGGGVRQSIGFWELKRLPIVIPLRHEQDAIVAFLDGNLSKVDQYIANKRREIELLNEYKLSLIAKTVIGGMNFQVKMKKSNIEWIGAVPAHWKQAAVRAFARPRSTRGRPDLPLLSVYREYGVIRKDSRDDNINPDGQNLADYKVVEPGDLVLNKMKTWQGSMGVSSDHGIVSPAYIVCKIKGDINPRYLHLLLRSRPYVFEYNRVSYGVREGQWDMRYDDFKNIPVFLPPQEEQDAIVDFLDQKIIQIDALIQSTENSIERMNEFRQSLITDAVIGKITIPSVA